MTTGCGGSSRAGDSWSRRRREAHPRCSVEPGASGAGGAAPACRSGAADAASWPVPEWARVRRLLVFLGVGGRLGRCAGSLSRCSFADAGVAVASPALPRVPFAPSLERSTRRQTQMETLAARRQYRPEPGYPRQAWAQMWRLAHRAVPPLALPARWVAALQRWSAARAPRGPCPQRPARRVAASSQRRLRPAVRRGSLSGAPGADGGESDVAVSPCAPPPSVAPAALGAASVEGPSPSPGSAEPSPVAAAAFCCGGFGDDRCPPDASVDWAGVLAS